MPANAPVEQREAERRSSDGNRRDPPMVRLAKRLVGPNVNGEAFGIALAISPLVLLGIWVSIAQPWTTYGIIMSAYYFAAPLVSLAVGSKKRAGSKAANRILSAALWVSLFAFWPLSVAGRSFGQDMSHAGATLLIAVLVWALWETVTTRTARCPACGNSQTLRSRSRSQERCSDCGSPITVPSE